MILVCGEALMDVFCTGATPTGMALDARAGGSPFNVALGLARLQQPVGFLGGISRGVLGARLLQALHDEGVSTACVWPSEAPTTLSLVGLDAAGVPAYAFYGEGAADRSLPPAALDALATLPAPPRALHLGSYTCVVEPVATTLRLLVQRLQGQALVSYDPNVRPSVVPDAEAWRRQLAWMLPRTQLLKLSAEDLAVLAPGTAPEALARHALGQGVELVVLTQGEAGVTAWTAHCQVQVPATPVQVQDTVGAGDTFQAALLTWLAEQGRLQPGGPAGLDATALQTALAFAGRAAAITCTRRGADLPRRHELG